MQGNGSVMNEWKFREQMCEIGRRIYNKGFAAANDGNISLRLSDDRVLCSPTRVSKGFMKPDDLCIVDLDGKQISGKRKRSSEILLHLTIMKARADVRSVVHCHPPHATAFAVAREPIPKCVLPEIEVFLGEVAIAPYETPGGQSFADTVLPYVKDTETILLANHGTVTYGADLEDAYFKTEIIDAYCRILILAKQIGRVNYYTDEKAAELLRLKPKLGIPDPRLEQGLGELRSLRQQPLPRRVRRRQSGATGVHSSQDRGERAGQVADRRGLDAALQRSRQVGGPSDLAFTPGRRQQIVEQRTRQYGLARPRCARSGDHRSSNGGA